MTIVVRVGDTKALIGPAQPAWASRDPFVRRCEPHPPLQSPIDAVPGPWPLWCWSSGFLDGHKGGDAELEEVLCRCLSPESEVEAAVVVLMLPASQLVASCCGVRKVIPSRTRLAALHSVGFGTATRDPTVGDAEVMQVPGEVGGELGVVVRLDPLDRHGQARADHSPT